MNATFSPLAPGGSQMPSIKRHLVIANIVMLVALLLHDLDHARQISTLCLKVATWQYVATLLVDL